MDDKIEYLTQEKFDELTKELQYLKTERRKEVAESLEYAKALGDISENAEYHQAREMQASIEDRIAKLENILKMAVIVGNYHGEKIEIGSKVTLEKKEGGAPVKYKIVGSEEADLGAGKLSISSPLGKFLIGKTKNQKVSFTAPGGKIIEYKILQVE